MVHLCGRDIHRPGHVCAFFDSREAEYDVVLPYLREGYDAGEEIVTVVDAERVDDHRTRLEAAGIASDQVSIASAQSTYLADGAFDMDHMVSFVRSAVIDARSRGRRVRTAGWMDWMKEGAPGTERAMEYEARMNLLVPQFDCTFLCVYDMAQMGGENVVDIMATHPWVIINGRIRDNPVYIPPEVYLEQLRAGMRPPYTIA